MGSLAGYDFIHDQCVNELGISPDKIVVETEFLVRYHARLFALKNVCALINAKKIMGNIAELGVFQGLFAREINKLFPDRKLYLFDTFEGFSSRDLIYEENSDAVENELSITSVELVLNNMPHREMCVIKKGYFPDTAKDIDDTFAFVSLDVDLYKPTLDGLRFFYPRLENGGYIFIHDFFSNRFDGVKKAVYEFMTEQNVSIVPIGDDCSIVITK